MDGGKMNYISVIGIVMILAAVAVIVIDRLYIRNLEKKLEKMIDSASEGELSESIPNESILSSCENKLARFVSDSEAASKNLNTEKERIKSLISDISHQTKTPASNILLYTSLLAESENLNDNDRNLVDSISEQTEKLNFLITSLIKTSRLESGIITVNPIKCSVNDLISSAAEQAKKKADIKNICIDVKETDAKAYFDMRWTVEAIFNIMDNAVKYTGENGRIEISAIEYEMFCRIDIKDNGIGISENDTARIFERFYRSRSVKNKDGVGIGLYLARYILSSENGYIKVKSEIGRGSIFSVFIPREKMM